MIGIISLPSGVFKPYSGVKTSILFLDKKIAKSTDSIFYAKILNDGYSLNDNRTPISENDLPIVLRELNQKNIPSDTIFKLLKNEILTNHIFHSQI